MRRIKEQELFQRAFSYVQDGVYAGFSEEELLNLVRAAFREYGRKASKEEKE